MRKKKKKRKTMEKRARLSVKEKACVRACVREVSARGE